MRILLADNQPKVRFGLRVLLERQPGLKVAGEATSAEELLAQTETTCPDLLLLDWELPGLAGGDLLSALRAVCPDLFVIVLSGRTEVRRAVLDAGADAFVFKCDPPERLLAAVGDCSARYNVKQVQPPDAGRRLRRHWPDAGLESG
jgi:DNA-binding NarL/FixJ family response regulator